MVVLPKMHGEDLHLSRKWEPQLLPKCTFFVISWRAASLESTTKETSRSKGIKQNLNLPNMWDLVFHSYLPQSGHLPCRLRIAQNAFHHVLSLLNWKIYNFVEMSLRSLPVLLHILHESRRTSIYQFPVESVENPSTVILRNRWSETQTQKERKKERKWRVCRVRLFETP